MIDRVILRMEGEQKIPTFIRENHYEKYGTHKWYVMTYLNTEKIENSITVCASILHRDYDKMYGTNKGKTLYQYKIGREEKS